MGAIVFALEPAGDLRPPAPPTPFSLLRQRKGGKRKAALHCARPLGLRPSGFPVVLDKPGPAQNSLRSLRSLRSDRLRESDHDVCLRRAAPCLRSSAAQTADQQPNSRTSSSLTAVSGSMSGIRLLGCSHPVCAAEEHSKGPACRRRTS
jgi:hypothetical protein